LVPAILNEMLVLNCCYRNGFIAGKFGNKSGASGAVPALEKTLEVMDGVD